MKTQYYVATSLDGFIADSHNSLDWLFQFCKGEGEEDSHTDSYSDFIREVGAIAMGSTTYEWVLTHQVNEGSDHPQAWVYEQPTWVFTSRSLPIIEGADIQFVKGDVRPVHQAMMAAAGNKNIWLVGGGDLVGQFHDHGLLNEIIVSIAPVTLGSGSPLLPRTITTPPLRLVSSKVHGGAFMELHYEVPQRYSSSPPMIALRPATPDDLTLLQHWDEQAHVVAADPNDDWGWEVELSRNPDWREQLIAEVEGRPIGFIQIIDPAREDTHYWGDVAADLRAIDIWIGEEADLGKGYGTQMMQMAISRCFADPTVTAILIDPLASNTRAQRFYERLGFQCCDRRWFGDDDCFIYRLTRTDWKNKDGAL